PIPGTILLQRGNGLPMELAPVTLQIYARPTTRTRIGVAESCGTMGWHPSSSLHPSPFTLHPSKTEAPPRVGRGRASWHGHSGRLADLHIDLAGLGGLRLRQGHCEYAVLEFRLHLRRVNAAVNP